MRLYLGLLLVTILALSCLVASINIFDQQQAALAQPYIQTIKYRNLVIDLGNGVKTNAQLTIPAIGKGPFPGVLLVSGSGAVDMNETLAKNAKPFWQIANHLFSYPKKHLDCIALSFFLQHLHNLDFLSYTCNIEQTFS
jgi:hypothetical protein